MAEDGYETFGLGDWELKNGGTIENAHLAYKTFGDPKSPAILYPTWFSGAISDNFWLIGEDKALNPKEYFIIIPALFGDGQSSSPSNYSSKPFPSCAFFDNIRAQHELLTEHLKIAHLRAVVGWSMGACQAYQWATQYPEFVDLILPWCGAAKTSIHNHVLLEGVKSSLLAARGGSSAGSKEGAVAVKGQEIRTWSQEEKEAGLKAVGRANAGLSFGHGFYREKLYEKVFGAKDLEDFMKTFWEAWGLSKDPENLLAMFQTWQSGDCSAQEPYNGDFEAAMQGIKAKVLALPSKTDAFFSTEDSEYEVVNMRPGIGQVIAFPSIWGHWAGGPGNVEDTEWLDMKMKEFFAANRKEDVAAAVTIQVLA